MTRFSSLILLLFFAISVQAQVVTIDCRNSCSYFGETIDETTYGFASDRDAEEALDNIMKYTGLPKNFILMAGNVPNAAAVIKCDQDTKDCQRYIIYNQDFMLRVKQKTNTDWAAVSILAHEIGHHLSGHTLLQGGSRPNLELEADRFSGFVLYNLGATLDEAQIAIRTFSGTQGSATHPGRSARIAAITNGWISASELKPTEERKATERIDNTKPRSLPSQGVFWTHDGVKNLFSVYVDGKNIASRSKRSYSGDDYLVYDPTTKVTYLLENFKSRNNNQRWPAKVLGRGVEIFWRHNGADKKYAVYVKGESVASRSQSAYTYSDYIVYDPNTSSTYFLPNFKTQDDNQLREGRLLGIGQSIFWRHDGVAKTYGLYVNGENVSARCNASYSNEDYIVYDPDTRKTYFLQDFGRRKDKRVYKGSLLSTGPSIYWRHNGADNTFALYVDGEKISGRTENTYSGDDYICYDPNAKKRYILENFRNLKDNQLRKGRVLY